MKINAFFTCITLVFGIFYPAFAEDAVNGRWMLDRIEGVERPAPKMQIIFLEDGIGLIRSDNESPVLFEIIDNILTLNATRGQSKFDISIQDTQLTLTYTGTSGETTIYHYVKHIIDENQYLKDRSEIGVEVLRLHTRLKHVGVRERLLKAAVEDHLWEAGFRVMSEEETEKSLIVPLLTIEINLIEISGNELIEAKVEYNFLHKPEVDQEWKLVRQDLVWKSFAVGQFKEKTDKSELVLYLVRGLINDFLEDNPH
ncbi:MAG: hypothetical protein P9L92_06100 [Candidatus Electryonea clarkiae]|nr:hypothetical protein [Candidatus Electryonea clarkiae]MDP8286595.1 hypothetical protein [Candidatus Electryonea clarkiae]